MKTRSHALGTLTVLATLLLAGCTDEVVCPAGETACGTRCVSLLADEANCGACGVACGPLEVCGGGACGCAPSVAVCGGECTDLARDPASCGACGAACDPGAFCTTAEGSTSCTASCAAGLSPCAGACVDVTTDPYHCGACGRSCAQGEVCRDGTCAAEIYVACFASADVRPVTAELEPAGAPRPASGSPTALAMTELGLYAASGFPAAVAVLPLGSQLSPLVTVLEGNDLQGIAVHGGAVFASNAGVGTIVVLDRAGLVLDEVPVPGEQPNPQGAAFTGGKGYVALFGRSRGEGVAPTGQAIARLDLAGLEGCLDAGPGAGGCATAGAPIDLVGVSGSASEGAYPFPTRALAFGARVFVTLSNLGYANCGSDFFDWCRPAGSGRLAVIDTAAGDAISVVDLGSACGNPGDLALDGTTLWVSCGSFGFPDLAPGVLVPVEVSGAPTVGPALAMPPGMVPGNLAFCGGTGYVTDQASGAVLRFDPAARTVDDPVTVCPTVFFAWAADVACAD